MTAGCVFAHMLRFCGAEEEEDDELVEEHVTKVCVHEGDRFDITAVKNVCPNHFILS